MRLKRSFKEHCLYGILSLVCLISLDTRLLATQVIATQWNSDVWKNWEDSLISERDRGRGQGRGDREKPKLFDRNRYKYDTNRLRFLNNDWQDIRGRTGYYYQNNNYYSNPYPYLNAYPNSSSRSTANPQETNKYYWYRDSYGNPQYMHER
jgi:hypothetical protein